MTTIRAACIVAVLASLALAPFAQAGTIYNNLGPGDSFTVFGRVLIGPSANGGDVDQATRFTTNGFFHEGINVAAGVYANSSPADGRGPVAIQVWTDGGATGPGSLLATNTVNVTAFDKNLISTTFAGLVLSPNTNYWVVLDSQGSFAGAYERNDQGILGINAGRSNLGAWSLFSGPNEAGYALRVVSRVETVPEPATMAALGLGALAMLRRRGSKGARSV